MPRPPTSPVSVQILDSAHATSGSISAGAFTSGNFGATLWPLLPNQSVRIYNVGLSISPDSQNAPGSFNVQAMSIFATLLDSTQQPIAPQPIIAGGGWANPGALLNGDLGALTVSASGDPLIEIVSNMFFASVSQQNGPGAAFLQIVAAWEAKNIDTGAHTITANLSAILSFVPRQ